MALGAALRAELAGASCLRAARVHTGSTDLRDPIGLLDGRLKCYLFDEPAKNAFVALQVIGNNHPVAMSDFLQHGVHTPAFAKGAVCPPYQTKDSGETLRPKPLML